MGQSGPDAKSDRRESECSVQMIQCGLSQNGIVAGAVYVQLNLPGHIQRKPGKSLSEKLSIALIWLALR